MKLKPLLAVAALATLLTACGSAEEPAESAETSSATEAELPASAPVETGMESAVKGPDGMSAVNDPIPSAVTDETKTTSADASGEPKSKFMTTYDAKRKKRFIPKCEREMAQDLKPDEVGEACNCLFDELANTLDGIKERLNPPDAKLEAANEKCLSKYL